MTRTWLERDRNATVLDGIDLAGVRQACGITQDAMAAGLGVKRVAVCHWERRFRRPPEAYCRVIAGLLRHLDVTWDEDGEPT